MTNHELPGTEPPPADRDWLSGRRWTGIAALGVIIVVLLCVVILLAVNRGGGKTAATGTKSSSSSPTSPRYPSRASSSGSADAALPTAVPTSAPAGVGWTIYQTVALPSADAGPFYVDGAIATGYAHTPLGALLATANESYRYVLAPDSQWRQAAAAMLADTAGKAVWLNNRAAHPYGASGATGSGDGFAQIAGFQFVSYTPSDAVIQLVTRDSDGNLQVGADHVTWVDTDWRFVPAADGGLNANVQQVDSLAGFVEWRGV